MSDDKLTLDDIAALIVQIEPTDLADLAHVRRGLKHIADSSPPSAQRPIVEAVKRIDQMTEGKTSDASDLLADIGAFIEEAINAMEKSGGDALPLSDPDPEQVPIVGSDPEVERFNTLP
jgi:hypothetical protein